MRWATVDPSVFFKTVRGEVNSMVILQVDDILAVGMHDFMRLEEKSLHLFNKKPKNIFTNSLLVFNEIRLHRDHKDMSVI